MKSHDFYFVHFFNIWQDICFKLPVYVDENHYFLTYSGKKSCANPMFLRFFGVKLIFANFHVYFQCIQISEGALTLWLHSDVIWRLIVLILVSMDRGGPYLYTGSKYMGICTENLRRELQQPSLRRTCYKTRVTKSKNPSPFFRKTRGSNNSFTLIENNFWFLW